MNEYRLNYTAFRTGGYPDLDAAFLRAVQAQTHQYDLLHGETAAQWVTAANEHADFGRHHVTFIGHRRQRESASVGDVIATVTFAPLSTQDLKLNLDGYGIILFCRCLPENERAKQLELDALRRADQHAQEVANALGTPIGVYLLADGLLCVHGSALEEMGFIYQDCTVPFMQHGSDRREALHLKVYRQQDDGAGERVPVSTQPPPAVLHEAEQLPPEEQ